MKVIEEVIDLNKDTAESNIIMDKQYKKDVDKNNKEAVKSIDPKEAKNRRALFGADKQPEPKKVEEPKATLDESLFEDLDFDTYSDFNHDIYKAVSDVMFNYRDKGVSEKDVDYAFEWFMTHFFDFDWDNVNESLKESKLNESSDKYHLNDYEIKDNIPRENWELVDTIEGEVEEDGTRVISSDLEKYGFYQGEVIIEDNPLQANSKVTVDVYKLPEDDEYADYYEYYACIRKDNNEESITEAKSFDKWDRVYEELCPDHINIMKKTKFPDVKLGDRYGQEGRVEIDPDAKIIIYGKDDAAFDFARRVCDEYDCKLEGPFNSAKYKVDKNGIDFSKYIKIDVE